MPDEPNEFAALMKRFQAGSQEAARELVEQYGPALLTVVRKQLSKTLRPKFDSRDFVQDAWVELLTGLAQGQEFDRPEALGRFLTELARCKVIETFRQRLEGQKYNVQRERSLDDSFFQRMQPPVAPGPTPSALIMRQEEWDHLLQRQPLVYRKVLILLREGKKHTDIARELGISDKTVRRVLDKVRPSEEP